MWSRFFSYFIWQFLFTYEKLAIYVSFKRGICGLLEVAATMHTFGMRRYVTRTRWRFGFSRRKAVNLLTFTIYKIELFEFPSYFSLKPYQLKNEKKNYNHMKRVSRQKK